MRFLKQLGAVALVSVIGSNLVAQVSDNPILTLALGAATAVLAILAYRWVVRRTEQRTPDELAPEGAVRPLWRGTLLGVALFGAVIVAIGALGHYRVDGPGTVLGALGVLGFMAAAATTEELIFRGILFRHLEKRAGTWIALGSTGLLFGLMHLANPNASLWAAIAIAVEAGGMLGAAYVATRSLWLPIGLHLGWNFAEAGIFGTEVSGKTSEGLLDGVLSGPALLSGGAFGPEASVFSLLAGLLATAVFMWIARRRGFVVPRRRGTTPAELTATLAR
ncbi:CPBP family intramembrane glutamic endopeptidase [Virgisporangium aliadipatigenens]|nr:CPBP family intramembrane glutamic endopeptidase [Virgisporangium aliadipatigenens]